MVQKVSPAAAGHPLAYAILQREMKRQAVRSMLTEGPGGPLAFLWALGVGALLIPVALPLLILPLTAAALGIGWLMLLDYRRDLAVVARLIPAVVRHLCPPPQVADSALRWRLKRGQQLFIEIALKVVQASERDAHREHLFNQTAELIVVLHESARQAEEFVRVLQLVADGPTGLMSGPIGSRAPELSRLLTENATALGREADRASSLTEQVVGQLQTLLLQLTQLGVRTAEVVHTAEFVREGHEALAYIQAEVSTRQEVAERMIADLARAAEMTWISPTPEEKGV